ncbi:MAG TPA: response regulator [Bacteroidia bacterium]|nr:response regulator [Bacteroidia bacterium]
MTRKTQMSIFIVEDNPMYSLYVDTLLKEQFNFKISTYESGEKCLKDLYLTPDIIILDYVLGGIDGLAVLSVIKKQLPDTPVILLTGQKDINTAIQLMKAGAFEYIIKDKDAPQKLADAIVRIEEEKSRKWKRFILV